jgi:cytochrome P450
MLRHPWVQKKAQAELDKVLGEAGTRMPTYEDKENLPYLNAVLSEVLRWRPVVPIGLPHRCMTDDVYRGYHIPAGMVF